MSHIQNVTVKNVTWTKCYRIVSQDKMSSCFCRAVVAQDLILFKLKITVTVYLGGKMNAWSYSRKMMHTGSCVVEKNKASSCLLKEWSDQFGGPSGTSWGSPEDVLTTSWGHPEDVLGTSKLFGPLYGLIGRPEDDHWAVHLDYKWT